MKSGIKTTEFWLTIITQVLVIFSALKGLMKPETALVISAVLDGVYAALRTYAKKTTA
jgi:hypothetical protein